MIFQFLAELNYGILLTSLTILCLFGIHYAWLVMRLLRYRRASLAEEARILNTPLPADALLPHVLVQIPTFNEHNLVWRVAEAVGRFDWPKDRLHIQILDDSTDGSVSFAEQAISTLQQQDIDAVLLHRKNRNGFKAGALAEGLKRSNHEYVVIFDVDYIPSPDFLRLAMRPLLRDPSLAFVQARLDFINADDNLATRVQRRFLDSIFAIERPARNWSGYYTQFNGTCGIFRRAAIDEAGGWLGDTLTEDIDLSYRIHLLGWRSFLLITVTVPGELPTTFKVFQTQLFRWTKGSAECAIKFLPQCWYSHIALRDKLDSTALFCFAFLAPILSVTAITALVNLTDGVGPTRVGVALAVIASLVGITVQSVMILLGQKFVRNVNLFREALELPLTFLLIQYVFLKSLNATIQACLRHNTAFVRTSKKRIEADEHGSRVKDLP